MTAFRSFLRRSIAPSRSVGMGTGTGGMLTQPFYSRPQWARSALLDSIVHHPTELAMNAEGNTIVTPSPWIASQRWDLAWLSMSALRVGGPLMAHVYWKVGATGVDLLVTLLIGGPHMYATFLRTVFEPRFRLRHPLMAWGPVIAVPLAVVLLSAFAFEALLSLFFMWASLHICVQASYIGQLYRREDGI